MVVNVRVGDGDPLAAVVDVDQAVVVVLAVVHVARNVAVVDPDVGGGLDGDGVAVGGEDLGNGQVAHDDVALLVDGEADALEL